MLQESARSRAFQRSVDESEVITFAISWVEITGLRGFAKTGRIEFAIPSGKSGSGLTILVGPNNSHSSEGLGEGLISLFFIVDALYDSSEGDIIAIDEPELSLHPSLQKKLASLLADYAKTRQIVLATHSPHFIDWNWILAGAKVVRVVKEPSTIVCHQLKDTYLPRVEGLLKNQNNPHIMGLEAKEVFFLEDNVILVEGQEDVIWYKRIADDLGVELPAEFYGWGVRGAGNMPVIAGILKELGFRNVTGIFDGDKQSECDKVSKEFPDYMFKVIPAEDVRSKAPVKAKDAVDGLIEGDRLKEEYRNEILNMFSDIKDRFVLGRAEAR